MTSCSEARLCSAIQATLLLVGAPRIGPWHGFFGFVQEIFRRRWLTNLGPLVIELGQALRAYLEATLQFVPAVGWGLLLPSDWPDAVVVDGAGALLIRIRLVDGSCR
jgi:hypothetical protein